MPALLIGLVALLATLQYRWLGKVSDAEREQLRRTLAQRAREFADEFDDEISRAYRSLQVPRGEAAAGGEATARNWTGFAASLERWKTTARDAQLMRAVYLAEAVGSEHTIRRWDSTQRTFDAKPLASWPESLEPVRRQLGLLRTADSRPAVSHAAVAHATAPEGKTAIVAMAAIGPVNAEVPALIVPVGSPLAPSTLKASNPLNIQPPSPMA